MSPRRKLSQCLIAGNSKLLLTAAFAALAAAGIVVGVKELWGRGMLNGRVSHWWEEAGAPVPRPELPGGLTADVAIVGAGFTGLWTAYYLKRARPGLKIVVVEEKHVGYGASGRNSGWLTNQVTGGRGQYAKRHGAGALDVFQRLLNDTVDEVIRVAGTERIDADIVRGGGLTVAFSAAAQQRLYATARRRQRAPHTDVELLDAAATAERIRAAGARAATWHPHAAQIQPAKLVRGLANAVERLGVAIYERTRAVELKPFEVQTTHGVIEADITVRATEGFTANIAGMHRAWLPLNSSLIATEPLPPEVWREIGWQGHEVLREFAHSYTYAQRSVDDRIIIGGRGVPYRYGSKASGSGATPRETVAALGARLERMFPAAGDAKVAHAWSGVLGVARDWEASVGFDPATGTAWAGGYIGTGAATSNLAGRTLADLILETDSELTRMPWVNHLARDWAPEPVRWLATRGMYAAYRAADRAESRGLATTSPLARLADVVARRR